MAAESSLYSYMIERWVYRIKQHLWQFQLNQRGADTSKDQTVNLNPNPFYD